METKSKEEIKVRLREINPDNIVAVVLLFLNREEFPSDPAKIHGGFEQLRQKEAYFKLLEPFLFVQRFPFAYSPSLENVLQRLCECRLLAFSGDLNQYRLDAKARKVIQEGILPEFSEEQQANLLAMALELKDFLEI